MYALDTLSEPFLHRNSLTEIGIREHRPNEHKQHIKLCILLCLRDSAFGSKLAVGPIRVLQMTVMIGSERL